MTILVDFILGAYPILILNVEIFELNNNWYFYAIVLAFFSTIDPLFRINFARHKITDLEFYLNAFKVAMSIFIAVLAFILPLMPSNPGQSVEQSNDIFFIVFSLFCFTKFVTLFTHLILKNKIVSNSLVLLYQTWPFLIQMLTFYGLILIFYAHVGRNLFGGRINNLSVADYTQATGLNLKHNYEYFHFNDIFSSILTLLVLIMQNNWIYVVELLYSVNNSVLTTIFIVSYNMLSSLIFTSLFYGVISRLIMIYFEDDFDHYKIEQKKLRKSVDTTISESDSSELLNSRK